MAKKGGSDGGVEVAAVRADEAQRQARVREGTTRISQMFDSQFNPAFFDRQRDNFLGYAQPQLADQHRDAARQLTFSLDRRGALDSSSRASLEADLERRRALAETDIRDQANDFRTSAMANVEGARGNLISTLNATGDVEGAVQSANARAQVLSQTPGFSPLSALFADFTSALGQQAAAERAFAYGGGPRPRLSTGLFGTPRGAVVNG